MSSELPMDQERLPSRLVERLEEMGRRRDELEKLLGDAEVLSKAALYRSYVREHGRLTRTVEEFRRLKVVEEEMKSTAAMLEGEADAEMRKLAQEELEKLGAKRVELVGRIQEGAARILSGELGLEAKATMGFAMALSEACQNIVEHAGTGGWVAVQAYNYRRRLGRRVAVIAVSDCGLGFRRSLEPTQAKRYGDRWRDGTALEAALIQGVSWFRDPGRGQGLAGIKRYLQRWQGKISVRSGTARIAIVPAWDDDVPLVEDLSFFPGAQLQVTIPAQDAGTT